MTDAWLLRDGEVLAGLEVASSFILRLKGLTGRSDFEGAFLLDKTRAIHTFGMRFAIDAAFCDAHMRVIDVVSISPNRLTRPRFRSRSVIEAREGAFDRWGLKLGDELEIKW